MNTVLTKTIMCGQTQQSIGVPKSQKVRTSKQLHNCSMLATLVYVLSQPTMRLRVGFLRSTHILVYLTIIDIQLDRPWVLPIYLSPLNSLTSYRSLIPTIGRLELTESE